MKEIWKPIENFENYEISSYGRIRSLNFNNEKRISLLKTSISKKGYVRVRVSKNNKKYTINIHKLVGLAYVPNPDNKPQINHLDGNKQNNYYKNLEWSTNLENQIHARENGLIKPPPKSGDNSCSIPVNQYELFTFKLIKKWDCINDVERDLKIPRQNVIKCCKKRRISAGNFHWCYGDVEPTKQVCPKCHTHNISLNIIKKRWSIHYVVCSKCGYEFLYEF